MLYDKKYTILRYVFALTRSHFQRLLRYNKIQSAHEKNNNDGNDAVYARRGCTGADSGKTDNSYNT